MSSDGWRPAAVSHCDELDPTKNIVPHKPSLGQLLLGNRRCCIQKKRVLKFAYYSYSVNFLPYYSVEYEYTIRTE